MRSFVLAVCFAVLPVSESHGIYVIDQSFQSSVTESQFFGDPNNRVRNAPDGSNVYLSNPRTNIVKTAPNPFDIAVGPSNTMDVSVTGNVLVANQETPSRVKMFTLAGVPIFDAPNTAGGNVQITDAPSDAVAFDASGDPFMTDFWGRIYSLDNAGSRTLVATVDPEWLAITGFNNVGNPESTGVVQSMAIDGDGNFFLGLNLGQRYGMNSAAVVRVKPDGTTDALAIGYGESPFDLKFDEFGSLLIPNIGTIDEEPLTAPIGSLQGLTSFASGGNALAISGDFNGDFSGLFAQLPSGVPEPSTWLLLVCGLLGLGFRRRNRATLQ